MDREPRTHFFFLHAEPERGVFPRPPARLFHGSIVPMFHCSMVLLIRGAPAVESRLQAFQ